MHNYVLDDCNSSFLSHRFDAVKILGILGICKCKYLFHNHRFCLSKDMHHCNLQ